MGSKGRPRARTPGPKRTRLAEAIRQARLALDMRQEDLAQELGVSVSRVRAWESSTDGKVAEPRARTLVALARVLRRTVEELAGA